MYKKELLEMDSSMADGIATRQVPESSVILSAAGTDLPPRHATPPGAACHAYWRAFRRCPISPSNLSSMETDSRETRRGAQNLPSFSFLLHVRGVVRGLLIAKFMGLILSPACCGPAYLAPSVSRCLWRKRFSMGMGEGWEG